VVAIAPDDSSTVYAATNRGLFRSLDGAATWTKVSAAGVENTAFTELVSAPGSTLYAMSDGVYVSRDGGDSFAAIEVGLPRSDYGSFAFIFDLARHPMTGELWGWNAGMRRFDSSAQRWVAVAGAEKFIAFWLAPSDPKTLYAINDQGFLASRDGGATWTVRTSLTSGWMVSSLAINPANASLLVAAKYPEGLIRSTDAGLTWSTLTAEQSGPVWFATKTRAYAMHIGPRLERSDDAGQTWAVVAAPGDGNCMLSFDPRDVDTVFAGCSRYSSGTGVYKSTDAGATWKHASEGIHAANIEALSADRRSGAVFVGTDSGLYRTVDRGATFQRVADGPGRVAGSPDGSLYAATAKGLLRSADDGIHWETVRAEPADLVAIHTGNPRVIVVTQDGGHVLRSTDLGASWSEVLCRCQIGTYTTFVSLVFDGDTVYGAGAIAYKGMGGLFRSDDAGATWILIKQGNFGSLTVDSGALVATLDGKVVRSTDSGQTWTGLYTGSRYLRTAASGPSGALWAGASAQCASGYSLACPETGGGVLSSNDTGITWSEPHPTIQGLTVRELLVDPRDPDVVYLGSNEGGLWITRSAGR
jgi:photosystem II stability/assembly factor-like uncharacterized protein